MKIMAFACLVLSVFFSSSNAVDIELFECESPDLPVWGGYGPKLEYYMPGDVIHYYCDVDTYIGGNYYRKCLDTGDWTGDTPVCDVPSAFKAVFQSSAMDDNSAAQAAVDGLRTTCTETIGGEKEEWSGNFTQGGELIRVRLFLPKGPANLEIVVVKENGDEDVCGKHTRNIGNLEFYLLPFVPMHRFERTFAVDIICIADRYDWIIQNCPGTNNQLATGLKIRSLTDDPLKICEIQAHVLVSPRCSDPHYRVESGRFRLTRKTANLVCDKGYTRSPDAKLECVRDGEWNRKTLYCLERNLEGNDEESIDNDDERSPGPDRESEEESD